MSPEEFDMDPSKGSREKRRNRGLGVNYELTEHAREGLQNRPNIRIEWIERILGCPELIEPDRMDPDLEHRLGRIEEYGGRVLRVIVRKNTTPLRLITFYFDRAMRSRL